MTGKGLESAQFYRGRCSEGPL